MFELKNNVRTKVKIDLGEPLPSSQFSYFVACINFYNQLQFFAKRFCLAAEGTAGKANLNWQSKIRGSS